MSKFVKIKEITGDLIVLNTDAIAYFFPIHNQSTNGETLVDIRFIGSLDEQRRFDIKYSDFLQLLEL